MNRMRDSLAEFLALTRNREIPRVGWPTSVLPPEGVLVEAIAHGSAVTIIVTRGKAHAAARLDLDTREVSISSVGRDAQLRQRLRRIALEFVADRNDYDHRCGLPTRLTPPTFDEHDPNTWTSMQELADLVDGDWYPPEPQERSPAGWAAFYEMAHRFNDRFTTQDASATTPHPTPPQDAQSSQGPATPDRQAPAAG
ncbi:hypothetical protein [Curtobacterium sp. MCPF17_046]|uniref:hypothetical protein n=1 Tax=Curtobacterium sp. MCPF17_046 TaxID=2175663 RepID=UPI0011B5226B|nr:hypothetical protein [Curtobacterium sp. MCPF17_046]